jgi:hypothetical protein
LVDPIPQWAVEPRIIVYKFSIKITQLNFLTFKLRELFESLVRSLLIVLF